MNELKTLQKEERDLKASIIEQQEKLRDIQQKIREVKGNDNVNWFQGAVECITSANEMLTTVEILQLIFADKLNKLGNYKHRASYVASLSMVLSKLEQAGTLIKIRQKGVKGFYYGLPAWQSEDGELHGHYQTLIGEKAKGT